MLICSFSSFFIFSITANTSLLSTYINHINNTSIIFHLLLQHHHLVFRFLSNLLNLTLLILHLFPFYHIDLLFIEINSHSFLKLPIPIELRSITLFVMIRLLLNMVEIGPFRWTDSFLSFLDPFQQLYPLHDVFVLNNLISFVLLFIIFLHKPFRVMFTVPLLIQHQLNI